MDEKPRDGNSAREQGALSYQKSMWKNFQEKTKPFLSPKRGADGKKETGIWMFRKKKVLDRVFSSSQPNLCCSAPVPLDGDKSLCGKPDPSCSQGQTLQPLGTTVVETAVKSDLPRHASPKHIVSHLVLSHQKSSSLGSACFERLVVGDSDSGAGGAEEQLRKNASDSNQAFPARSSPVRSAFCVRPAGRGLGELAAVSGSRRE
ncbi:hypothetical protein SKAU_G00013350 [Synaphobranchus kaupii]|uniref:Uncharacterized protein n=1 Tax=Synaphobranchus kaupii TaxID=118154 RepID=A0A9Q1GAP0_SYNKA|nr:hypothetical protein SKAU_G00013350 [Synaphobranchus kaupii]